MRMLCDACLREKLVMWQTCRMRLIFWLYEMQNRYRVRNKIPSAGMGVKIAVSGVAEGFY
jgi:hypothetical protein